jgi:hypothetical protein
LHFTTDGLELRSYGLLIGYTIIRNRRPCKVVRDFTKANFVSKTTSRHVNLAKRYADLVVKPKRTEAEPEEVSNA